MLEYAIHDILKEATGIEVRPLYSQGLEPPFIAYNITPITGGTVKQSQLNIYIVNNDFEEILNLREKINSVLDLTDKHPSIYSNGIYFRSSLSGGGTLHNDETEFIEDNLIYTITFYKKERMI